MFAQEVNAFLQDGGLVHLPCVAWQHCAEFFDEDIELVSPFLLRFIAGHTMIKSTVRKKDCECYDKCFQEILSRDNLLSQEHEFVTYKQYGCCV